MPVPLILPVDPDRPVKLRMIALGSGIISLTIGYRARRVGATVEIGQLQGLSPSMYCWSIRH
jgi:hypothetical protein